MTNIHLGLLYVSTPALLLSIITITLNIFVIKFYWKSELSVVPLLYISIASMDILTAIGIIHFYAITLLIIYKEDFFDYTGMFASSSKSADVNVMILTFFLQVSCRCSVFCNLVLAVSRTVMILKPFYQINIKLVKLTCVLYAVPWIVLYGLNVHEYNVDYAAHAINGPGFLMGRGLSSKIFTLLYKRSGGSDINIPVNYRSLLSTFYIVLLLPEVFAFVIPVIVVIITCVIQVISIRRSSQFPTSSNQRHVTITVLLMSTLFVLSNSPFTGYNTALVIFFLTGNFKMFHTWSGNDGKIAYITVISATVLPMLNAALNPVIIISRSSGLRRKFSDSIQGMLRWIRERLYME